MDIRPSWATWKPSAGSTAVLPILNSPRNGQLKERRPDLYKALFEKETHVAPQLKATADKLTRKGLSDGLIKYLDKHPEVNAVFFQRGGRTATSRTMGEHSKKFFGNFIFDNRWELMNKAATFPGDVWRLAEERIIEPLAWVDQVQVSDPEGTEATFEVDEKQAQAWTKGAYQQGHLYMFPHQATGRFPYSTVEYPAFTKEYNPRFLLKISGVFAGTSNHTGSFPRIEVRLKDGYVTEVKGGGIYGDVWREFLKYSQDQRPHLSFSRSARLLVDLRSGAGSQSQVFQAAR